MQNVKSKSLDKTFFFVVKWLRVRLSVKFKFLLLSVFPLQRFTPLFALVTSVTEKEWGETQILELSLNLQCVDLFLGQVSKRGVSLILGDFL